MKKDISLHPAQATILRVLLFQPEARFSDLNTTKLSNDHFTFHIQQLVSNELVHKTESGHYSLTSEGKEFANRFDTETQDVKVEKQAKLGVAICCVKQENGKRYYLLQQRLKQPYFGNWGFMTGKIKLGESVYETAKRELQEEMGIEADLVLTSIKHKTDFTTDGKLLEDKYFFKFRGDNVRGELIEDIQGGKNQWVAEDEIKNLDPVFHDLYEGIEDLNASIDGGEFTFEEKAYTATDY